jgi:hypothetical protein
MKLQTATCRAEVRNSTWSINLDGVRVLWPFNETSREVTAFINYCSIHSGVFIWRKHKLHLKTKLKLQAALTCFTLCVLSFSPKIAVKRSTLPPCIRQITGSNLSPETNYYEEFFSPSREISGLCLKISHGRFLTSYSFLYSSYTIIRRCTSVQTQLHKASLNKRKIKINSPFFFDSSSFPCTSFLC